MKPAGKGAVWAAGCVYLFLVGFAAADVRSVHRVKAQRLADFAAFSELYLQLPPFQPAAKSSDPLLIRLQKSAEEVDLRDRAPKWSGKDASAGLSASVTLSVEGVPFERLSLLLEKLSTEPDVSVPSFRLERSGASKDRFDFAATFSASSSAAAPRSPSAP